MVMVLGRNYYKNIMMSVLVLIRLNWWIRTNLAGNVSDMSRVARMSPDYGDIAMSRDIFYGDM